MTFRVGLHNFSKGVLSDELQGRQDVAAYNAGMKRCEHAYILKYGGIAGRPGTRVVYETETANVRLVPFEVSDIQNYMMLFEQASMKPMTLGGMVLEQELVITGITRSNPAQVTVAYHGLSAGDEVFIGDQLGMIEVNDRIWKVLEVTGVNTFTIDADSSAFGVWTGNVGGAVNPGPPPPPPSPPPEVPPPPPPPVPPAVGGNYPAYGNWKGRDILHPDMEVP
ncbi:MAG TPA: hypothetical protein VF655_00180 [Allosphingosinicella sp.]|jgi:hypothetical protein